MNTAFLPCGQEHVLSQLARERQEMSIASGSDTIEVKRSSTEAAGSVRKSSHHLTGVGCRKKIKGGYVVQAFRSGALLSSALALSLAISSAWAADQQAAAPKVCQRDHWLRHDELDFRRLSNGRRKGGMPQRLYPIEQR